MAVSCKKLFKSDSYGTVKSHMEFVLLSLCINLYNIKKSMSLHFVESSSASVSSYKYDPVDE